MQKVKSFRDLKKLGPAARPAPAVIVRSAPRPEPAPVRAPHRWGTCPDCGRYHELGADGSGCAKAACERMGLPYVPPAERKNWSKGDVDIHRI
jgi:hypothetical protein